MTLVIYDFFFLFFLTYINIKNNIFKPKNERKKSNLNQIEQYAKIKTLNNSKERIYLKNPYKPGAGTIPEYLAGRSKLLHEAQNTLNELLEGGMASIRT